MDNINDKAVNLKSIVQVKVFRCSLSFFVTFFLLKLISYEKLSVGKSTKRGMALINPFPRRAVIFEFDRLK